MFVHPDSAAFSDFALAEYMHSAPYQASIEMDRELVRRGGLSTFTELAWGTVEAANSYKSNWHIDAIAEHLEAVSDGDIRRLIIAVPPRHMKSVSVAVMWPAHDWIKRPDRRFLFSSYALSLSIRDSVKCRRVIQSPWYQARWGKDFKLTGDQNTKGYFENSATGYRMSTSVDGALTGHGGSFVVVDDPISAKNAESAGQRETMLTWWKEVMSTRLNDPATGAFVIIQQRLHENDLIGDIVKTHGLVQDDGDYHYLCLPAEYEPDHPHRWFRDPRTERGQLLWPNRVPRRELEALKKALGPYASAGQLQQRPAPREGGMFKRSWFPIETVLPADLQYARGWDLAATEKKTISSDPDWTATVLLGFSPTQEKWYIVDVKRWRAGPAELLALIQGEHKADQAAGRRVKLYIPQDPGQAGKYQADDMRRKLGGADVVFEPQTGEKQVRAGPLASQAIGGNLRLMVGDWNDEFLHEITGFPTGAHDDMVDAASSAFTRLTGGETGLLDYYRKKLLEQEQADQLEAMRLAANGGTLPGMVTFGEETSDLGQAFTSSTPDAPVWG